MAELLGLTSNKVVSATAQADGTETSVRLFIVILVWLANALVPIHVFVTLMILILFMDALIALAVSFLFSTPLSPFPISPVYSILIFTSLQPIDVL
jgi:hypothetical protein